MTKTIRRRSHLVRRTAFNLEGSLRDHDVRFQADELSRRLRQAVEDSPRKSYVRWKMLRPSVQPS